MQRNTGAVARALARTQLVAILVRVVDTTAIFVRRKRERKKEPRGKMRGKGLGVESPRCAGNQHTPPLFPSFLSIHAYVCLLPSPLLSVTLLASLFLSRFHQADASRTSPPFELPAGNVAYLAGYLPWREGYTSSSSCQIHGKRISAKAGSAISLTSSLCTPWMEEAILLTNSKRLNRSFKIVVIYYIFFTLKILSFFFHLFLLFFRR